MRLNLPDLLIKPTEKIILIPSSGCNIQDGIFFVIHFVRKSVAIEPKKKFHYMMPSSLVSIDKRVI